MLENHCFFFHTFSKAHIFRIAVLVKFQGQTGIGVLGGSWMGSLGGLGGVGRVLEGSWRGLEGSGGLK